MSRKQLNTSLNNYTLLNNLEKYSQRIKRAENHTVVFFFEDRQNTLSFLYAYSSLHILHGFLLRLALEILKVDYKFRFDYFYDACKICFAK